MYNKKPGADKTRKEEDSFHENKKHELTANDKGKGSLTNLTKRLNV